MLSITRERAFTTKNQPLLGQTKTEDDTTPNDIPMAYIYNLISKS
jgi:hypothetical protein